MGAEVLHLADTYCHNCGRIGSGARTTHSARYLHVGSILLSAQDRELVREKAVVELILAAEEAARSV